MPTETTATTLAALSANEAVAATPAASETASAHLSANTIAAFDKATYTSGEKVTLTASSPAETITKVTVSHLGKEIYSADPANAKAELPSDIFSPNSGYTVTVSTANSAGATKTQTLGLSVEDDWTLYPRYGVVGGSSDHNASMTNDQLEGYQDGLEQLTQMHINNYFFYDVYDTTGNPFPANTESYNQEWVSWSENKPKIDTGLVKSLVNYIHENGGKAMLYNMINAVSVENGQTEASVPESVVNGAAIYNAKDHSDFGKTGNLAQTSVQRFVDPANPEWQKYIIDTMIKAIKEGNFDGWQADTMGNNVVYKINEDGTKTEFNMSDGYDDLSKAAAEALKELGYSYMINDINTGNAEALSQTGISVPYSEIWPIAGDDQYSDLKELVDRLYSLNNVSPILSVYTEKGMDATGAESLNPDSELLVDAIVAASGGYHMTTAALNSSQNANGFGIIQSEYYPNQNMKTTPALAKSEFNYQQFITAYEELLRGKGLTQLDNHATIQASDGVDLTSTGGEAGKVYTWTKATAGGDYVVQMINLAGVDKSTWKDGDNNTLQLDNLNVSIPLDGQITKEQAEKAVVYVASPDKGDISMTALQTTFVEENGVKMLKVTVPNIDIWDMLYVTNLNDTMNSAGNDADNIITGNDGNNRLDGGNGNDTMNGGNGNDTVNGDAGDDTLLGESGNDHLNGGAGNDSLTGGDGGDTLLGESGTDTLTGGAGDDVLFGGLDNDLLHGEAGNDTYVFSIGEGQDTVSDNDGNNAIQFGQGIKIEDLHLEASTDGQGATDWTITIGNTGDAITIDNQYAGGNSTNISINEFRLDEGTFTVDSLLEKMAAINSISGTDGADNLTGTSASNTYYVNHEGDRISEAVDGGIDQVHSSVNYTLDNNVENLTLTGTADINGAGNDADNIIIGNDGNNRLDGGNGNDTMNGGNGNDTVNGDAGGDTLFGESGNDHLNGGAGNDSLTGGDGGDTLLGESGTDTLTGGAGDDVLFGGLDNDLLHGEAGNDTYVFSIGEGQDTVSDNDGNNAIQFGQGIKIEDLHLEASTDGQGATDWTITIGNTGDAITIDNQYAGGNSTNISISEFRLDEGTFTVDALLEKMAANNSFSGLANTNPAVDSFSYAVDNATAVQPDNNSAIAVL